MITIAEGYNASRICSRTINVIVLTAWLQFTAFAQTAFTWQQIKAKFQAANPTLKAAQLNIDESRAEEITAYLRPNPDFSFSADGFQVTPNQGIWRPFSGVVTVSSISYLHERQHKRELRLAAAKESTEVAASAYLDQERGLIFTLQSAFVQTLQAKAFIQNAQENLKYWDRELEIDQTRFRAGDLAKLDIDRLELQRVQFESDYETALVNLRTAKIQLLQLLNERTPIETFDVSGPFEFSERLAPLEEFRNTALETRPDLKEAEQNVQLAKVTYQLTVSNGSTDPTWSVWYSNNPSFSNAFANQTVGGSVSIPLRIFDRNQGEKARTWVDIGRNEKLRDAAQAQVFNDVDSAYYTVLSNVNLLKPYKDKYLSMATEIRDKMQVSYLNGGNSLLDYLDAEKALRDTKIAYLTLVGSYLTAVAQMDMAVGREVEIQ